MSSDGSSSGSGSGSDSSQEHQSTRKRRRLFSRRELRHQGVNIVRAGSANILQPNRGPYTFATVDSRYKTTDASQQSAVSEDIFTDREPIENFTESSIEQTTKVELENQEIQPRRRRICDGLIDEMSGSVRRSRRVVSLSSRRLRLSPTKPLKHTRNIEQISPPSSPLKLPPPLDLDQGIMSFPQSPPLSARLARSTALTRHNPADMASRLAQDSSSKSKSKSNRSSGGGTSSSARQKPLQLTPLRLARDRLKSAKHSRPPLPPPLFDIDGLSHSTRARRSSSNKKPFAL
ncbi:hypothetical protein H4R99_007852 [Coemansia sp. RSA 1722]|nr:hypothetical protein IWW45_002169 [Coemansia sp. RSA 485]KAJ2588274.1 hypothetical protein H4R99_007852 [Coemansia sp. RSA 1722]